MQPVATARRVAFSALIDFAGLFPPASLGMGAAVAAYRAARSGDTGWVAGRFLCPTSRLEELASILTTTMTTDEASWPVGAVFDEAAGSAASHAATFHAYADPAAAVTSAEARLTVGGGATEATATARAASSIGGQTAIFLEVPLTAGWEDELPASLSAVATARSELRRPVGAKLRCGGADPGDFPSPEQVAMFIICCEQRGLAFKATAGLHRPLRHRDDDLGVMRHGFVNLLAASAVAAEGAPFHDVAAAVAETDPAAFSIGVATLRVLDRSIPTRALSAVRDVGLVAYGSCDFDEPVEALEALGML